MNPRPERPQPAFKNRNTRDGAVPAPTTVDLERGVRFLQQNNLSGARDCFERAAHAHPLDAVPINCLGIVARLERRLDDAIDCFEKALELRPNFAEAYNNLGNARRDGGQLDMARDCYRRAITLKPVFPDAYNNLGVIHLSQRASAEAIRCFETAIQQQPTYAEAHNNLANAFRERGELIDAVASFTTALHLKPAAPEIHNNLGNVLRDLGQIEEAQRHYEYAVSLMPDFAEAHSNLANALLDLDDADGAIKAYLRAGDLDPRSVAARVSLGNAYKLVGQAGPARAAFVRAMTLDPVRLEHSLRVSALCSPVFLSRQEIELERRRALHEWPLLAEQSRRRGGWRLDMDLTEPSFHWQFLDGNIRPLKEVYANIFGNDLADENWPTNSGRPRIGIVVARGHEGLFVRSMGGVLERLDDSQFEIVIVCPSASESNIRDGIARRFEFLTFPHSAAPAAKAIRAGDFAVLYYWEIGTDAVNYFLPFFRAAPVQCTSWGIQVTSGIPAVNYYLSSDLVEPPEAQDHYSERLLLAPTLLTYQQRPHHEIRRSRESFGFTAQQHLYVCDQQPGKFHPDFDALLAGILSRDPLGIVVGGGDRYGFATQRLRQRLVNTIPDGAQRIQFMPRLDYGAYLDLLAAADVLLDPPHFGGVNSTYDGLALSKPIVTWPSAFHRGRYTAGCYRKMGVEDCIVHSAKEFVDLAVTLATEPDLRWQVSQRIRDASDVLFQDFQAVHAHQQMFEQMIEISRSRS